MKQAKGAAGTQPAAPQTVDKVKSTVTFFEREQKTKRKNEVNVENIQ